MFRLNFCLKNWLCRCSWLHGFFWFFSTWKAQIFHMVSKVILSHISLLFLPHIQDLLNEPYPAILFQANGHFKSKGIFLDKPWGTTLEVNVIPGMNFLSLRVETELYFSQSVLRWRELKSLSVVKTEFSSQVHFQHFPQLL